MPEQIVRNLLAPGHLFCSERLADRTDKIFIGVLGPIVQRHILIQKLKRLALLPGERFVQKVLLQMRGAAVFACPAAACRHEQCRKQKTSRKQQARCR